MSQHKDDDIWRKRYIRLLTEPVSETTDSSQDDLQGIEDLVGEKLVRAHINHDIDGVVSGAAGLFCSDAERAALCRRSASNSP
jgi:hypothetical protein